MNNYMIVCQFRSKTPSTDFIKAIEYIDLRFDHPIDTIWYIQSHHSIDYIQQTLLSMIDIDDILIINAVTDQRTYNKPQTNQKEDDFESSKSSLYRVFSLMH